MSLVTTNSSGDYNYTFTAPSSGGTYPVKVNMTYAGYYGENTTNLTVDTTPPDLWFTFPPSNQSTTSNNWIFINVSANENLSTCLLNWIYNNTNITMTKDAGNRYCYANITGLSSASYYFRVYGNDTAGNMNVTEDREVTIDITAPDITWNMPASNNSFTQNQSWIYWNATISETPGTCYLNINGTTNYTMSISESYCYYNSTSLTNQTTYCGRVYANDSAGNLNLSSSMCITVNLTSEGGTITIESIAIQPDEGNPGIIINPVENSSKAVNVTVTVTNSTSIDACEIRIFNSSMSYSNPVFLYTGTIQNCGATCDCFKEWDMEYWRNDGDWNVSVYINLTTGVGNFTSENFTYNALTSISVNTSTITFTGIPEQTVNSTNAYPLEIKNTGNQMVNISIKGTDYAGLVNSSYVVGVGNSTYNETANGVYQQLTYNYVQIFEDLTPAGTKSLFFKAYLPAGFIEQDYQNTIEITT